MKIDLIAGARPNFMKISPIIDAIKADPKASSRLSFRLIHTGQHYDRNMSGSFFEQLGIPEPNINLGAGGGTQAEQTAAIMAGYEKVLQEGRSDLCLVVGDVTSTMACSMWPARWVWMWLMWRQASAPGTGPCPMKSTGSLPTA